MALRMGELTDSSLTTRKIGQCQRCVVGSPVYFKAKGIPQTPADLVTHEAVIYEQRGGGAAWTFRRGTAETSVTVEGRVRVSAAEGVREAVFVSLGFAIASEWMFAPELASGAVKSVLDDWSLPPIDLWAAFPTGRQASAKARSFASVVEKQIASGAAWSSGAKALVGKDVASRPIAESLRKQVRYRKNSA